MQSVRTLYLKACRKFVEEVGSYARKTFIGPEFPNFEQIAPFLEEQSDEAQLLYLSSVIFDVVLPLAKEVMEKNEILRDSLGVFMTPPEAEFVVEARQGRTERGAAAYRLATKYITVFDKLKQLINNN